MDNTKSAGAPATKHCTEFDAVDGVLSFANDLAGRVERLADRLLGCVPATVGSNGLSETPDGVLPRMAMATQYTRGRLGDAMAALDRIEKALP